MREALIWSSGAGLTALGDLPGGPFESLALDVSGDGSVVVGQSHAGADPLDGTDAFRWTQAEGMQSLGSLPGGGLVSRATGITTDGSVIVGDASSANVTTPFGTEAFRWTESSGMVGLGDLPGGEFGSIAWAIAGDGGVIVGEGMTANGRAAFRWVEDAPGSSTGIMLALGDLPGGAIESVALGVSPSGGTIVGHSASTSGSEAFRWTELLGLQALGDLDGGGFASFALDVSGDGATVVGYSDSGNPSNFAGFEAFIWDETNGMRSLQDVLSDEFGLDLAGWSLVTADGISDDGRALTGTGVNPAGDFEAWYAVIPEPNTGLLLTFGLLALSRHRSARTRDRRPR